MDITGAAGEEIRTRMETRGEGIQLRSGRILAELCPTIMC